MTCSFPQQIFNENLNLQVTVNTSGSDASLWLENVGENIWDSSSSGGESGVPGVRSTV